MVFLNTDKFVLLSAEIESLHYGIVSRDEAAADVTNDNTILRYNQLIAEKYDGKDPEYPTLPQIEVDDLDDFQEMQSAPSSSKAIALSNLVH
ncbi:MAG: hypothetical protein MHMPM18_005094 [Marteilia pararefringens]